ncbi:MAG TPA: hypothetical protein PK054_09570 [Anaerohalosphaeraceae bacterium]|nr:hypothetical protein [Anaerohalosphaeraceae bacterium]
MQRKRNLLILLIGSVWVLTARGAVISFSTTAPVPQPGDVYNFTGAAQDRDNVGGDGTADGPGNDATTYVAFDRPAQGQTFLTGSELKNIRGIWVRHPGYSGNNPGGTAANNTWYAMAVGSQLTVRITNPAAAGTEDFVVASETATITGTEPGVLPAASTNSADGTGTWIHLVLDRPVPTAPNTVYGFDLTAAGGTFFELLGIRDAAAGGNPYSAGSAYTSGANGAGGNTLTAQTGDRVFLIEMGPYAAPASNPDPADGAQGVDSDAAVTLSWDAGLAANPQQPSSPIPNPNILYHYLYIVPNEPNFLYASPIAVGADTNPADGNVDPRASYTLGFLLNSDTTYYWRVDEILNDGTGHPRAASDPNNLFGPVWSFETEKKNPQLNPSLPADVAASSGEQVTFVVQAVNPLTGDSTGLTYQWYRNGVLLSGQTNSVYVRTVQSGDEGSTYYCRVTLPATGRTVQSRTATILVKKLLAYWSFDGSVSDASGNNLHGVHIGDPNYAAGKVNLALEFDGTADYVDLPDGFADFTTGLTITLWAKPTAAPSYARFIDWGNGAAADNILFYRVGTTNTLAFNVYQGGTAGTAVQAPQALESNVWQFLAVTMDGSGNVVLYKNGRPIQNGTVLMPNVAVRTVNYIGESNWAADALYAGLMDEVKLYNYAMTPSQIAQVYYEQEGEFCLQNPVGDLSGPQDQPDCVVDLYDLKKLAEDFLLCGFFPECP